MFSIKKIVESGLVRMMEINRSSMKGRRPYGITKNDESVEEVVCVHMETTDTEFVDDLLDYIEQYRCDRQKRNK